MNDELVYALIALAIHWRLGWCAARKMRHIAGAWDGFDEVMAITLALLFGSLLYIGTVGIEYYEKHGSLFGKGKE